MGHNKITLMLVSAVISLLALGGMFMYPELTKAREVNSAAIELIELVAQEDYAEAYKRMSAEFQNSTSFQEFSTKILEDLTIYQDVNNLGYRPYVFEENFRKKSTYRYIGEFTTSDNQEGQIGAMFVSETDEWKLDAMMISLYEDNFKNTIVKIVEL